MQLNPSRPFFGLFATGVLLYIIYIFLSTSPIERVNRICTPLALWPKKVVVSGLNVFASRYSQGVANGFDGWFDNCRKWTWGIAYADEYRALMAKEAAEGGSTSPPATSTPVPPGDPLDVAPSALPDEQAPVPSASVGSGP